MTMIREARSCEETSANPRVYTKRFPRRCVEPVKTSLSNSLWIQELEPKNSRTINTVYYSVL